MTVYVAYALDRAQNPPDDRLNGSKALVNACMEYRYINQFSKRTRLRRGVYEKVAGNWQQLGLAGTLPTLLALED